MGVRGNKICSRAQGHRNQDLGTAGLGGWLLVPRESLSQPLLSRHDQGSTSPRRWQHSMEQGAVMPTSQLQVCPVAGTRAAQAVLSGTRGSPMSVEHGGRLHRSPRDTWLMQAVHQRN